MKSHIFLFAAMLCLAWPTRSRAQFTFTTNNGAITITSYTGPRGSVTIPSATNGYPVTTIGQSALSSSLITGVTLPDSITNIGIQALYNSYITNVAVPASVQDIGTNAFGLCVNLTNIDVDPQNSNYSSLGGVLFDKSQGTLIEFPIGDFGDYSIPNTVTNIADFAFNEAAGLTQVIIPNNVITIGSMAFSNVSFATNLVIGNGVTSIGAGAFYAWTEMFSLTIGDSVTSIPDNCFWACTSLRQIIIPNNITSIGSNAFAVAYNLTNVVIGNGVTNIGPSAFYSGYDLNSVTFGNSVATIASNAFNYCSLTNVVFPATLISIGPDAFGNENRLTNIYFRGNAPAVATNFIQGYDLMATIYYVPGTLGWGTNFDGFPTVQWALPSPVILNMAISDNEFDFDISWATNRNVVVQGTADLSAQNWTALQTNSFTNGLSHYSDPAWTAYPNRYYRVSAQ